MKKVIVNFFIIFAVLLVFIGCTAENTTPLNVYFKDGSITGSPNHTITAVFQKDKRVEDFGADILIKTNTENTNLKITKELGKTYQITLTTANEWQSLIKLLEPTANYDNFSNLSSQAYIISTENEVELTFKAIGGELTNENQTLTNTFPVSNEFLLKI